MHHANYNVKLFALVTPGVIYSIPKIMHKRIFNSCFYWNCLTWLLRNSMLQGRAQFKRFKNLEQVLESLGQRKVLPNF